MLARELVVFGLIAGLALPAAAQVNPFPGAKAPKLSAQDITSLLDASRVLNTRNPVMVGQTEAWNGETQGTVRLDRIFQAHGTACHTLSYRLRRAAAKPRVYHLNWCVTPDGAWKNAG
jgi:hypothetical protein